MSKDIFIYNLINHPYMGLKYCSLKRVKRSNSIRTELDFIGSRKEWTQDDVEYAMEQAFEAGRTDFKREIQKLLEIKC